MPKASECGVLFSPEVLAALKMNAEAIDAGWAFGRWKDQGLVSFFISDGMERDVVTLDAVHENYVRNTGKSGMKMVFPESEQQHNPGDAPLPTAVRTKMHHRNAPAVDVDTKVLVRTLGPTSGFWIWYCVPGLRPCHRHKPWGQDRR